MGGAAGYYMVYRGQGRWGRRTGAPPPARRAAGPRGRRRRVSPRGGHSGPCRRSRDAPARDRSGDRPSSPPGRPAAAGPSAWAPALAGGGRTPGRISWSSAPRPILFEVASAAWARELSQSGRRWLTRKVPVRMEGLAATATNGWLARHCGVVDGVSGRWGRPSLQSAGRIRTRCKVTVRMAPRRSSSPYRSRTVAQYAPCRRAGMSTSRTIPRWGLP